MFAKHYAQYSPHPYHRGWFRIVFYHLPQALVLALVLLMLSASPARAEQAADVNGVESGHLLLRSAQGGAYVPALMQSTQVHFDIAGLIARVTVEQQFRNTGDEWVEGVYAFPLPERAAVRAMEMRIGERRIVGEIKEKAEAKRVYQQAVRAGKKASLVEQQRPNLFTNRVANIAPGEAVVVKLEYVEEVSYLRGAFSLRFPTTITPRYMPGTVRAQQDTESGSEEALAPVVADAYLGWAQATDEVPDADAISPLVDPRAGSDAQPLNPVVITANLDVGVELGHVESAYHQIALAREGNRYQVRLAHGVAEMDRDFLLSWTPVTGAAPQAAFFTEQVAGEYYGLLLMLPPNAEVGDAIVPRELVFVIDTSGSMGGQSITQARQALTTALRDLRPQDYFNIIEFDSHYRMLHPQAVPASRHYVAQAQEFVRQLQANGGTEMLGALRAAMPVNRPESGQRLRQIVFITDGAVGNEEALFTEIHRRLGSDRLYTVGIGSAPNSWFMRKAAQFGRGTHLHIGDVSEVEVKMRDLLAQIAAPVMVDLAVEWPGQVEAWPQRVPDLYRGEPVVVAVNFGSHYPAGEVAVSGKLKGQPWQRTLQLPALATEPAPAHTGVGSVWARRKIEALLDDKVMGADATAVRAAVLEVALPHSLMSPYTSFVAVEQRISRPAADSLARKPVPNTAPKGQSPQTFAYPRGATWGPFNTWLGCLCLFLALLVYVMSRPEEDRGCVAAL